MKKMIVWLAVSLLLAAPGCRSTASLDRSTPPAKSRRSAQKKPAPAAKKRGDSVDPAFDLIFKRNPQKPESSIFTDEENRRLRGNREADESMARSVRGEERLQENKKQKDWVFGTKDGKYF